MPSASPRPRGRLARALLAWARRPALAVTLLAVAVAVSVAHGQPPPADRASGVSVPVRTDTPAPPQVGTVVLVAGSGAFRFNTETRRLVPLRLPPRVAALRVWTVGGIDVALGRLPYRLAPKRPVEDRSTEWLPTDPPARTAAWIVRAGRPPVPLGLTDTVTPSVDGRAVWLVNAGVASRVALRRDQPKVTVRLPRLARLVGDTPGGLVVTTGAVLTREQAATRPAATATPAPLGVGTGSAAPTTRAAAPGERAGVTTSPAPTGSPSGFPTGSPSGSTTGAAPPGVPLTTMLVRPGGPTRLLAEAEGLAAFGDVVLVRREDERLGVVRVRGPLRIPRWLPNLSAVEVTGRAALDYDGATFAVLARVNEHVRLMTGPIAATTEAEVHVVALDGGPPTEDAAPPAFTASGRVLAVRPDGKVVYYLPGNRSGVLLGADLPPAADAIQG